MKNLEQCISSQEQVEESLQISFWDTDQSLLSNGTNTLVKSSEQESQMDGLMECQCGKEMSRCSIHPNTKDEWIASMQDSLAKILASQELNEVLAKTRGLDFTDRSYGLQTRYDLNTCSWKTSQGSLVEMMEICSEQSLETLPREATIVSGVVYQLPMLVLTTNATDGGCLDMWPTPIASQGGAAKPEAAVGRRTVLRKTSGQKRGMDLQTAVRIEIPDYTGGGLNPTWVEWLMGWPLGHTDLKR